MNFECNSKNQSLNFKLFIYFAFGWSLSQLSIQNDKDNVLECVYINMFKTIVTFYLNHIDIKSIQKMSKYIYFDVTA